MKVAVLETVGSLNNIKLVDRPEPRPGAGEVLVRLRAAALNYRDLVVVDEPAHRAHEILDVNPRDELPAVTGGASESGTDEPQQRIEDPAGFRPKRNRGAKRDAAGAVRDCGQESLPRSSRSCPSKRRRCACHQD